MNPSCFDCGLDPNGPDHVTMLPQTKIVAGKTIRFNRCWRCWITRGQQDQAEMREQLERSMKLKAKEKVA